MVENTPICRGSAIGRAEGAKNPLKISKKGKIRKHVIFLCIKVIKISFSVIFNKEIHALEGITILPLKRRQHKGAALPPGPPLGLLPTLDPHVPSPLDDLPWRHPCLYVTKFWGEGVPTHPCEPTDSGVVNATCTCQQGKSKKLSQFSPFSGADPDF